MIFKLIFTLSLVLPATALQNAGHKNELPKTSGVVRDRRSFIANTAIAFGAAATLRPKPSEAIGPVKVNLINPVYTAKVCPKDRAIPGEKAMKGLRGLCVTVQADLETSSPKELEKVGVYGYIMDASSGDSVLANNPDLSTDAGQFTMIPLITTKDKKVEFEFIAAIPKEIDISVFDEGIQPLRFKSLRVIAFPGGQQYGAVNPCEMNEFSPECETWEEENGPYVKGKYMVNSNSRTKGR